MVTHNRAAAHSGNTDFIFITSHTLRAAVVFVVIASVHCLVDGISQCQRGSTRRIQLLVVMFFHDFNIKACVGQNFSRILYQLHQSIDAKGHISGTQDCGLPAGFFYLFNLLRRKSGRAEY